MALDETFNLFHRYGKLVRRGLVKPLACHCGEPYGTSLGKDDKLLLNCYFCDTEVEPGEDTIGNVRAVVKEHFSE